MEKRLTIAVLVLLAIVRPFAAESSPVGAQNQGAVTIQDAIIETLRLNPGVQIEKEKIEQSRALVTQSAGAFDWVAYGSAATSADESDDISVNTSLGVTKRFRNGIEITPSFSNMESSRVSSQFIERSGTLINVKIRIPLLRGLGSKNAGAEEQAASLNWTASKYLSKHNISDRVNQTATRFWECLGASRVVDILADSERRSREIVDLVQLLVDGGELSPVYLGEATGRFYQVKADAEQSRFDFFRARQALAMSMGNGPTDAATPAQALGDFPPLIELEEVNDALVEMYTRQALQKRGDYLASLKQIDARDVLLQKADNDKKARIDFTLDGGYASIDETLLNNFSGPSHESLSGLVIQGKVNVEWALSDRFSQGNLSRLLSEKRESKLRSSELANAVVAEIVEAIELLRFSIRETGLARQSKEAYLKSVKQERNKIEAGAGDLSYLITLDQNYSEACISQVRALQKYAAALVRLRFVTGTILEDSEDEVLFELKNLMELPPVD